MIIASDPIDFLKKWRKREMISQKSLAGMLGVSVGTVGDFESGRRDSARFCLLVSILMTDSDRLHFFDLTAIHYSENKKEYLEMQAAFDELKRRGKLHEINQDDMAILRANGYRVDSIRGKWTKPRGPRRKQRKDLGR